MLLTLGDEDLAIPLMPLVTQGLRIEGSVIAPRHCNLEMLEFADRNHIRPMVQNFPLSARGITEAMDLLRRGKIKYRAVLTP